MASWRLSGSIGWETAPTAGSFVATLLHDIDLGADDIPQDYDGNREDLWAGSWSGSGDIPGVSASSTAGVIADLDPGDYQITLSWAGATTGGEPLGDPDTNVIGLWVGPSAPFSGVSVPFAGPVQGNIPGATATATVTVTDPAYTQLHLWSLNRNDASSVFIPAGSTVTITRL